MCIRDSKYSGALKVRTSKIRNKNEYNYVTESGLNVVSALASAVRAAFWLVTRREMSYTEMCIRDRSNIIWQNWKKLCESTNAIKSIFLPNKNTCDQKKKITMFDQNVTIMTNVVVLVLSTVTVAIRRKFISV